MNGITPAQQEQLLKPLNRTRVAKRAGGGGKQLSYLEAWDVKAHLIRIFGFGGFSADIVETALMFEEKGEKNWTVGYKVVLRLCIHATGATYTEAAVGSSIGTRADAHDNAVKNGASDAIKRCAINLGSQFGLSLYDDGATRDVVMKTLVGPTVETEPIDPTPESV
jgi:recombination DNA repair RAD52 pathway protein